MTLVDDLFDPVDGLALGLGGHEPVRDLGQVEQRPRLLDPLGCLTALRGRVCDQHGG
jgi:hypothetical protein